MRRLYFAPDGEREFWPERAGFWEAVPCNEDGAAARLVSRILHRHNAGMTDFETYGWYFPRTNEYAEEAGIGVKDAERSGYRAKLKMALALARTVKCMAAVILVDTDTSDFGSRRKSLCDARESLLTEFPDLASRTVIGEACRNFEAWLISSPESVSEAFQAPTPSLPASPESQDNPKALLEGWLAHAGPHDMPIAQKYAEVAGRARVELMEARCPTSFEAFSQEVSERIAPLF